MMTQLRVVRIFLTLSVLVLSLAACAPAASGTVSSGTAVSGTAVPILITSLPSDGTLPPTQVASTSTLIPTLPSGLSPTELKYKVLAQFPDFFYCDPDYYPVARADELTLALQRFPEIMANPELFNAILAHNQLTGQTRFTNDQELLIYREYKKLNALHFELAPGGYSFQLQEAKTKGSGQLVTGTIDAQGKITVQKTVPSIATCPICLAAGTLIDTPTGPVAVQDLRPGLIVWTMDLNGSRVAAPVTQVGKTVVPLSHQVVHLVLEDGRQLRVSPGHPTADGSRVGDLTPGENLDGSIILSVQREAYTGYATYDLLPAGGTGFYWANGILLASTLK